MAYCATEIAILHYSYGGFHSRFPIGVAPCSQVARGSKGAHSQSGAKSVSCRLKRMLYLAVAGLAYGIHLEDDLATSYCSYNYSLRYDDAYGSSGLVRS